MGSTFNAMLGKRLRNERRSRDLRQQDIAEELNVSTDAVSAWEAGANGSKTENLVAYLQVLSKHDDGMRHPLSLDDITGFKPAESRSYEQERRSFSALLG